MRKILLFGAGKSATVLIDYLLRHAMVENWTVVVVDTDMSLVKSKLGNAIGGIAASFDILDKDKRQQHIQDADIVISLLPPSLHFAVAKDCIHFRKHLLTASYVDEQMRTLEKEIEANGLLFLCEMGLDPGIDHMTAIKMINEIKDDGGLVTSFISHCGGLAAPGSDNNPWRYKISWNPKNVVLAGKSGARFRQHGIATCLSYEQLFSEKRYVDIPGHEPLCWYPNRDSTGYSETYGLKNCPTFIRTTLRHPDFIYGWKNLIDLKLTDEEKVYQTDGLTLKEFFQQHMQAHGFSSWLQQKIQEQFATSKKILEDLVNLVELEEQADDSGQKPIDDFMVVNEKGNLQQLDLEDLKTNAAATVAYQLHEAKLTLKQLFFLGMDDGETFIDKGLCSAADVLTFVLEKKLPLLPADKDMVIMLHEIEYTKDEQQYKRTMQLLLIGEEAQHTAMAKTVGLPLGIAAKLILNGIIKAKGLCIPLAVDIYEPVLKELATHGIEFHEENILSS